MNHIITLLPYQITELRNLIENTHPKVEYKLLDIYGVEMIEMLPAAEFDAIMDQALDIARDLIKKR